jgi:hypothetical protein
VVEVFKIIDGRAFYLDGMKIKAYANSQVKTYSDCS